MQEIINGCGNVIGVSTCGTDPSGDANVYCKEDAGMYILQNLILQA